MTTTTAGTVLTTERICEVLALHGMAHSVKADVVMALVPWTRNGNPGYHWETVPDTMRELLRWLGY